MEFQVRYLSLFLLLSVIDSFGWFWMGSLHKNIQSMLEFLRAPFLFLHFSYNRVMTFLSMLSVKLLSMLIMLLPTLIVIRHLICGSNQNCLLTLNLIYETLQTGAGSGLLILMLKKQLILYDWSNNTVAIDVKMDKSVLEEKSSFKMLGFTFSGLGLLIISIVKTASKNIGALISSMKFLLSLLCVSISLTYGHAWNTVVMSGLIVCMRVSTLKNTTPSLSQTHLLNQQTV